MAQEVFENTEKAVEWMLKKNEYFFDKSPLEVCLTDAAGVLELLEKNVKERGRSNLPVLLSEEEQAALAELVKEIESDG